MHPGRRCLLTLLLAAPCATSAGAGERPVAVSPGSATGAVVESRCPTFSWGMVEGARGYEVVIYRLEQSEAEKPVLRQSFPGSVGSWTPSLDACLERGGRYAWSIRALTREGGSAWSSPSLFEVAQGPSAAELVEALAVVRMYLGERSTGAAGVPPESAQPAAPGQIEDPGAAGAMSAGRDPSGLGPESFGEAALTVEGEVRTVSPGGAQRLWGRGRPGTRRYGRILLGLCEFNGVRFGLSQAIMPAGSAADACPAGTWVCTREERGVSVECYTVRPDDPVDARDCNNDPINWLANEHRGWVASAPNDDGSAPAVWENANESPAQQACLSYPVWCCSE